jgi:beta-lactamase regulating signal transducer with metallopeptidase domain/Tol biopolymer transport system component
MMTTSSWLWDCVWQSTFFLGLGGLLSLLWHRRPARAHQILLLTMAACLATPVLSEAVRQLGWGLITVEPTRYLRAEPSSSAGGSGTPILTSSLPTPSTAVGSASVSSPQVSDLTSSGSSKETLRASHRFAWRSLFAGAWLVLSALALVRLGGSLVKEVVIWRRAKLLQQGTVPQLVERAACRLGLRVRPQVYLSDRVASPVICCWGLHPTVVIPQSSPRISGDEAWMGILCHELAHWKRRDHWAALVSEILLVCLPWHPLVWWTRRRLDQLGELACDNWVLACGQPSEAYAESLLSLLPQRPSVFALPVVGFRKKLETRIRSILSAQQEAPNLGGRWAWVTTLATLLIAGMVAFAQSRSMASPASAQTAQKRLASSPLGLSLRLVTKGWASDFSSIPSPDGRYVFDFSNSELMVRDLASGKSRLLTKDSGKAGGEPWYAAMSPDNKLVVYNWFSNARGDSDELRLVKTDGAGTRVLYTDANTNEVNPVQWSADGKKILATVDGKGTCQFLLISAVNGSVEVLKTLPAHSSWAGLSPDSRYLAYDFPQRGSTNVCDVFLYDTRDRREIPLIAHPADDRFLGWSLDGKWIVFSSDRWGTADLWVVQVGDGKTLDAPRLVKSNIGAIKPKGFTRDGSFYYTREFHACDVYTASLDLDTGRLLEAPVPLPVLGDKALPAWSHDGRLLAYLRLRKESEMTALSTLAVYSLASGEVREFDPGKLGYYDWKCSGLRWSSDDRFILAEGYGKDEKGHVYQIDIPSGRTTVVADLSADGKTIVFPLTPDAEPEAVAMLREVQSVRNKVLETAPDSYLQTLALSPDRRSVAFGDRDKKTQAMKIMVMPVAGGAVREVVPPQAGKTTWLYQIVWTTDGHDLLYVMAGDNDYVTSLWKVSAQGGPARRLWVSNPRLRLLTLHPDGRRIAFGSSPTLQHEVWVLENFLPKE